jgi:hypothetical protein
MGNGTITGDVRGHNITGTFIMRERKTIARPDEEKSNVGIAKFNEGIVRPEEGMSYEGKSDKCIVEPDG